MYRRASLKLHDNESSISRAELRVVPIEFSGQIDPIRHIEIFEEVESQLLAIDYNVKDEFHALTKGNLRYAGLIVSKAIWMTDWDWCLLITNNNDGKGAAEIHSGIVFRDVAECIAFHVSFTLFKKVGYLSKEDMRALVNENIDKCRDYMKLEDERMTAYKKIKISREVAHNIICELLMTEIVAGRCAFEVLTDWNNPQVDYIKPRTLWSLFVHCLVFINRLKTIHHIERSKQLHEFFDEVAKFNSKPTKWVQSKLI